MSIAVKSPVSRNPAIVRARILDAAQAEFMAAGFAGASSNRILQRFGGSKATMFRHFPTMWALFTAVVARIAVGWQDAVDTSSLPEEDPQGWLAGFAQRAAAWLLTEENIFVGRMAIAEGHLFPEVQGEYVRLAVKPIGDAITLRLARWHAAGLVVSPDPRADAQHFCDLAFSGLISRRLYRTANADDDAARARHLARCVAIFLHGLWPGEG